MTGTARRAVVLVPYLTHIEPACERGLRELERRGLEIRRHAATAAIDRTRSELATAALDDGFDELIWIDSDIAFEADDLQKLRGHDLALAGGIYPKKGPKAFAAYFEPGTEVLQLGTNGGPSPVRYLGLGFLCTQRRVYADVQQRFSLPRCEARFGAPAVPYFLPMVIEDRAPPGGYWYLGEDYAFCERARQAGHPLIVDTTIRLGHVGGYQYSWEDAVQQQPRVAGLTLRLSAATATTAATAASSATRGDDG